MAQAARLSLRMQKELKLLLTDPPPGASFPLLTGTHSGSFSSSSDSSLSTIEAEIQGPEETVYAGGVFKIKIQIPERYPFHPPTVTFVTPIYHPNIDNGGRICLDILNLPPKGAWQPSLNISTVITSIGLLLSEPNPDDGLMCEASKEYKYNRQAFNLKARTLTERHAKPGCRTISASKQMDPEEVDKSSNKSGKCVEDHAEPLTSELSLDSSPIASAAKGVHGGGVVKHEPAKPSSGLFGTEEKDANTSCNNPRKRTDQDDPTSLESSKSCMPRRRLSLNCSSLPKREHDSTSLALNPEDPSSSHTGSIEISSDEGSKQDDPSPHASSVSKPISNKSVTHRKLSLGLSVGASHNNCGDMGEKENLNPVPLARSILDSPPESSKKSSSPFKDEVLVHESEIGKKPKVGQLEQVDELQGQGKDVIQHRDASSTCIELSSPVSGLKHISGASSNRCEAQKDSEPEAAPDPISIIVLDSDESDGEIIVCRRSRLPVSRKRFASKGSK